MSALDRAILALLTLLLVALFLYLDGDVASAQSSQPRCIPVYPERLCLAARCRPKGLERRA